MVGVTSMTWWNWDRRPRSAIPRGQETMSGARTPPAWVFCLYRLSGVLPACAQPQG